MAKFNERFFCPCPWKAMYFHINEVSPCHLIRYGKNMTPSEYLKSDWLKEFKTKFVNGEIPKECAVSCKAREDLGLKSTRGAAWHYLNVGESPEIDISEFTIESETKIVRLEIRASNLCNFKCRMCTDYSSSEIAKENLELNIPLSYKSDKTVLVANDNSFDDLRNISLENIKHICFTGGEPFLTKQFYDYMDFLIDSKINERVLLELFTNCSVYNPLFVERLMKFDKVHFVMSIDGVGKTAEYQRHGTDWKVVEENIFRFVEMPKKIFLNTAITPYVLLDVSSLAKFIMELYQKNNNLGIKCYTVNSPPELQIENINSELRDRILNEIDASIEILKPTNFLVFTNELLNIRKVLVDMKFNDEKYQSFVGYTKKMDVIRNKSFEDVFGYGL